jgi:hypothetical protein
MSTYLHAIAVSVFISFALVPLVFLNTTRNNEAASLPSSRFVNVYLYARDFRSVSFFCSIVLNETLEDQGRLSELSRFEMIYLSTFS